MSESEKIAEDLSPEVTPTDERTAFTLEVPVTNVRGLVLDPEAEPAALSAIYQYLHARGLITEDHVFSPSAALQVARKAAANPAPEIQTYSQDWENFKVFSRPAEEEDARISDLEQGLARLGYEVAGVLIRRVRERDEESPTNG